MEDMMVMVTKRCETAVKQLLMFVWAAIFANDIITTDRSADASPLGASKQGVGVFSNFWIFLSLTDSVWDSLGFFFIKYLPVETWVLRLS